MDRLRAVVADDHGLTLSAVSDSLSLHGVDVVARSTSARDTINAVVKYQPDVLVVDLDLGPGPSGIDVATNLRRRFPQLGIVVLSGFADPRFLSPGLSRPPSGTVYLVKQQLANMKSVVHAVEDAVARACAGDAAVVPRVALTDGQIAVLDRVARGWSNSAIADDLVVTEDAVAKHVSRIAKRLGIPRGGDVNTRVALARTYLDLVANRRET